MKKTLLMAVSAIALLSTVPAYAETTSAPAQEERTMNQRDIPQLTKEETKEAWENTKDTVSEAARDTKQAIGETYDDIKSSLQNKGSGKIERVAIDPRVTANGLIGKPVYNSTGERVAKVHDIILDKSGDAEYVILTDGEFTGLGDLVAFDFDILTKHNAEGYLLAPLTEESVDKAKEFKYKTSGTVSTEVASLDGGVSARELIGSNIVDTKGKTVAEVEDITFSNGQADRLIVSFGQILGMGGDKAAMTFGDVSVKQELKGNDLHVELSNNTLEQFQAYKKSLN